MKYIVLLILVNYTVAIYSMKEETKAFMPKLFKPRLINVIYSALTVENKTPFPIDVMAKQTLGSHITSDSDFYCTEVYKIHPNSQAMLPCMVERIKEGNKLFIFENSLLASITISEKYTNNTPEVETPLRSLSASTWGPITQEDFEKTTISVYLSNVDEKLPKEKLFALLASQGNLSFKTSNK
jgi:hypothetical protein